MTKRLFGFFAACLMFLTASAATSFPSRTDFRDEQIYFVMTTRFYDGDASNNTQCWEAQNYNQGDPAWRGDFKGLIEKMDYIKALGFTAIWITPVVENASGYDYHGYHASNFSKVDHRYESEDVNFQTVINEAHKRGMKIILDIVLNHTGNFGEENLCKLFTRDWSADQSSIDDCMIPYTKKEGGKLPDNYLSLPGGQQYEYQCTGRKSLRRLSQVRNPLIAIGRSRSLRALGNTQSFFASMEVPHICLSRQRTQATLSILATLTINSERRWRVSKGFVC
jgi:glycosidase